MRDVYVKLNQGMLSQHRNSRRRKGEIFTRKFNVKVRENLMKFFIWGTNLFGAKNLILLKIYQ
jgi:hypothetical protein